MEIIGKPSIKSSLFFTSKLSIILIAVSILIQLLVLDLRLAKISYFLQIGSLIFAVLGLALILISISNLGESIRVGLPSKKTSLKTSGLYRISRNPIYLGADIIALSAIVYTLNPVVFLLGIYCIIIHHKIILSEEKFLITRFGKEYKDYLRKVRRYI